MGKFSRVWVEALVLLTVLSSLMTAVGGGSSIAPSAQAATSGAARTTGRPVTAARAVSFQASAAQGAGSFSYHGGPLQTQPVAYLIFWGSGWGTTSAPTSQAQLVKSYFQDVGGTFFNNVVTQYSVSGSTIANSVQLGGAYVDTAAPAPTDASCAGATTIGDGALQSEVSSAIAAAGWPKDGVNALYLVFTPNGISVSDGNGACSEREFCSYHKWSPSVGVAYAALPYPSNVNCQVATSPNNDRVADSLVNLASSAALGAITDAHPGTGWVDDMNLEMAQKCAWIFPGGPTALNNGGTFEVQSEFSNATAACVNHYAGHFNFTPAAVSVAVNDPGTAPQPASLTLQNTGTAPLNWRITTALPSWLSVSPTADTLAPGSTESLTLTFNLPASTGPQRFAADLVFADANADNSGADVPVTVVEPTVSTQWYFAEGFLGSSFRTLFTVENPGPNPARVTFTYNLESGAGQVTHAGVQVAPYSRYTENVNSFIQGQVPGYSLGVATSITSDQPIVVERPLYYQYTNGVNGQSNVQTGFDVLGATSLSSSFSFGYLDASANHRTLLTYLNPGATPMYVHLTFYAPDGTVTQPTPVLVPAKARATSNVADWLPPGVYSGTVSLTDASGAALNGLVERPMYATNTATGYQEATCVIGVAQGRASWYFAEGFTGKDTGAARRGQFYETLYLAYPAAPGSGPAANVTITIYKETGGAPVVVNVALNPGHIQTVSVNNALAGYGLGNSIKVTADQPILAQRLMTFDYGASDVLGAPAPGYEQLFAEGFKGPGFVAGDTFADIVTIENPNTTTAYVTTSFLPENGGAAVTTVFSVAPQSRYTFLANTYAPTTGFSMQTISNVPILVERPLYWEYGETNIIGHQPDGSLAG